RVGAKGVSLLLGDFALRDIARGFVESRNEVELAAPAAPFGREVFSQRISLGIILRQQNAPEIGMAGKMNAHHVIHFPFQELGSFPNSSDRRDRRIVLCNTCLEAKTLPKWKRVQVVHEFKP